MAGEGYAGIALDVIEALSGGRPRHIVLNVPNAGAIPAMERDAVVEIPAHVSRGSVRPLAVGEVPPEQLGLMLQVKAYERLTIAALAGGSRRTAVHALAVHPLVRDAGLAERIFDDYAAAHGALFPSLS